MSTKQTANLAEFVLDRLPENFLRDLIAEDFREYRIRVFPWALTIWLMLCQRFGQGESLAAAVDRLREGECDRFLEQAGASRRVRAGLISNGTGAYSQARSRIPLVVIEQAADHLNRCVQELHKNQTWQGRHVYLVDGSTLTLPHSKALLKEYPSCENQYGQSRWPKMRTCYAHDLVTGVALRPAYGAYYGKAAVSEIRLFLSMMDRLPTGSVIVGDRLYGSFRIAYESISQGHDVVLRFAKDRARPFLAELKKPGDLPVKDWQTGEQNRRTRLKDLPAEAKVNGRFIWHKVTRKGYRPVNLFLFTTLPNAVEEIVSLYGLRWNIETDIRSIKGCLNLEEISSKTPEMVHKEVILAHTAFNLVRHITALIAGVAGVDPRRVSFKRVLNFVTLAGPKMVTLTEEEQLAIIERFAGGVRQILNPKRSRPPEPRKLVLRRREFPFMLRSRAIERKALLSKRKRLN
jgi:hypothetical protein